MEAEFGAGAVLISMGAILGKCSLVQLFGMSCINVFFYTLNRAIVFNIFKTADIGESMTIHTFGAYFGVASTWFFTPKVAIADKECLTALKLASVGPPANTNTNASSAG